MQRQREICYEHSPKFVPVLEQLGCSLLVSTYQADRLVAIGTEAGRLAISFHGFEQAMGVAVSPQCIAVGTGNQVWMLPAAADIAGQIEPVGRFDACYLARSAHLTGEIHLHEMAWAGVQPGIEDLWLVNTLFSCLCQLDGAHSFLPRWRPPFISALAAEDRCHLNGVAMLDGRPRYVTVFAQTDTAAGWRPGKANSGCILDVDTGEALTHELAMPHSPRMHQGRLWVLDSGRRRLLVVDRDTGRTDVVTELPGYARGLAFCGPMAFVGLSKARETATFGGLPLDAHRDELKCGIGIIEVASGQYVGHLEFRAGIDEIFDVQVLAGVRCPAISGPLAKLDGQSTIWVVPESGRD